MVFVRIEGNGVYFCPLFSVQFLPEISGSYEERLRGDLWITHPLELNVSVVCQKCPEFFGKFDETLLNEEFLPKPFPPTYAFSIT
jgi:hypothetical protein